MNHRFSLRSGGCAKRSGAGTRWLGLTTLLSAAFLSSCTTGARRAESAGESVAHTASDAKVVEHRAFNMDSDRIEELDESASLNEMLAYAALKSEALKSAFHLWRAAVERVTQAKTLPDPKLTYRYFIEEVETRVGPQEQSAGLSQTFPWFGKLRLRGEAADEAAKAAWQRYEAAKLALFYRIKEAYNEYYYLGRAISIVENNVELVEHLEQVARARYRTDSASHPDVIRAQLELGKLEDNLLALRAMRRPMASRLNATLNRPAHAPLAFPAGVSDESLHVDDEHILALAGQSNPELRALERRIAQSRKGVELARKQFFPDLTISVDYTDVGRPSPAGVDGLRNPAAFRSASRLGRGAGDVIDAFAMGRSLSTSSPDDAGQDIWSMSMSLNIPIWRSKYAAGEREARARMIAAQSELKQRRNDLEARLTQSMFEYRDAERKLVLYRNSLIPKARASIGSTETAFRAGKSSFLDLVDAERTLLDLELAFQRALANRGSRLAELEMLVGTTLPRRSQAAGKVGQQLQQLDDPNDESQGSQ